MHGDLEAVLELYAERSKSYLDAERSFRTAKAEFIISLLDPALRPKRPTELEINALVDGNEDLNNKRYIRDMAKVYLDIAKAQLEMLQVAYEQ